MLKVSDVLSMAATILVDEGFENRTPAQLIKYLRSGLERLALAAPTQLVKTALVDLVAGSKQTVPSDGEAVFRVIEVYNDVGRLVGYPRQTDLDWLSMSDYKWSAETQTVPRQYANDSIDPAIYWVYPPAVEGYKATIQYKVAIKDLATNDELEHVDSYYAGGLAHFVAASAMMEDSEYGMDGGPADKHMNLFNTLTVSKVPDSG